LVLGLASWTKASASGRKVREEPVVTVAVLLAPERLPAASRALTE
jgi:hypothetical protein